MLDRTSDSTDKELPQSKKSEELEQENQILKKINELTSEKNRRN